MKEKFLKSISWALGKKYNTDGVLGREELKSRSNTSVKRSQLSNMLAIILMVSFIIGAIVLLIKEKTSDTKREKIEEIVTVELPDQALDADKYWRNYFEEKLKKAIEEMQAKLKEVTEEQSRTLKETNNKIEEELFETKEKLAMAQRELASASLDLKRVAKEEGERAGSNNKFAGVDLGIKEVDMGVEMDTPKSAESYIPEGTYFTGHLLGGIAVSTAINKESDGGTPVTIKLYGRFDKDNRKTTNLSELNKLDLSKCQIEGSSRGDLSAERIEIRLEKMVCLQDGMYVTSKIAGIVHGPDSFNGIKADVVDTSSKHLKNVAIGGMISGLTSVAKNQSSSTLTGSGLIYTPEKSVKTLLGDAALQGVSNTGDKIADLQLRTVGVLSPVMFVPAGVRVNPKIEKGFFVGQIDTHKKIKALRDKNINSNRSEYEE